MCTESKAWYSFAITDATALVLVDGRGLPPECSGLAGNIVEIRTALRVLEAGGVVNPGLSHHEAYKQPSGPGPQDDGQLRFAHALVRRFAANVE